MSINFLVLFVATNSNTLLSYLFVYTSSRKTFGKYLGIEPIKSPIGYIFIQKFKIQ
jgi:hypothetical protein